MADYWQLEENTDRWQLEENTDRWLLEESVETPPPLQINNYLGFDVGDGMSTSEKIK